MKSVSGQELHRLHDLPSQHTRAHKASCNHSLDTYLTAAIELKLHESIKLKWTEYSSESETTPLCTELLKFSDIQARHHESVAQTTSKVPTSASERKVPPRASYAARPESMCLARKRENHQLHTCPKFHEMSHDERWALVKKNSICLNCLRVRNMANKCCMPLLTPE